MNVKHDEAILHELYEQAQMGEISYKEAMKQYAEYISNLEEEENDDNEILWDIVEI